MKIRANKTRSDAAHIPHFARQFISEFGNHFRAAVRSTSARSCTLSNCLFRAEGGLSGLLKSWGWG